MHGTFVVLTAGHCLLCIVHCVQQKTSPQQGLSMSPSPIEEDRFAWKDNHNDDTHDDNGYSTTTSTKHKSKKFVARPWGWEADAALLEELYDREDSALASSILSASHSAGVFRYGDESESEGGDEDELDRDMDVDMERDIDVERDEVIGNDHILNSGGTPPRSPRGGAGWGDGNNNSSSREWKRISGGGSNSEKSRGGGEEGSSSSSRSYRYEEDGMIFSAASKEEEGDTVTNTPDKSHNLDSWEENEEEEED